MRSIGGDPQLLSSIVNQDTLYNSNINNYKNTLHGTNSRNKNNSIHSNYNKNMKRNSGTTILTNTSFFLNKNPDKYSQGAKT